MKALLPVALFILLATPVAAQELLPERVEFWRAEVVRVISSEEGTIIGTDTLAAYQTIEAKLLEGERAGETLILKNDYLKLKEGESFYVRFSKDGSSGLERFAVSEPYRIPALLWLGGLFLVVLLAFGGKQGLRGLIALGASLFCIVYLLLPGIMAGYPPILVALGVAAFIIVAGSYITHGFYRSTHAAVLGMLATVVLTGTLAYISIYGGRLSGYSSEETVYLHFSSNGGIDLVGLLLAGLLIGLLGVLYDAAISQAIAIEELSAVGPHLSRRELFLRGLRIGREHIGALVNTLAIAYAGVSLPLLLLLTTINNQSLLVTLNQELFATELVRMLVGSIGIILAVPITTAVATYLWHGVAHKRPEAGHHHAR